MAVYKVPQDVEADDKLIGPFSPRQALYAGIVIVTLGVLFLIGQQISIVAAGIAFAFLSPVIIVFGALALPLRKDQPMEAYLIAHIQFYFKPKLRMWQPEGIVSMVEITTPKIVEPSRTKNLSQDQARDQLKNLASLMDTRGWSARGLAATGAPVQQGISVSESDISNDMLDDSDPVAQSFGTLVDRSYLQQKKQAMQKMMEKTKPEAASKDSPTATKAQSYPTKPDEPVTSSAPDTPVTAQPVQASPERETQAKLDEPDVHYNPFPSSIHQQVITPGGDVAKTKASKETDADKPPESDQASKQTVSPDIINLANNSDLSLSAISHEAHRLEEQKRGGDEEVVISLR